MLQYILVLLTLLFLTACQKAELLDSNIYQCELSQNDESESHPKAVQFEAALDQLAAFTPGIQVAITTQDGNTWTSARGFTDIPNEVTLQPCHKLMVGSISKVFTAVLIMQLQEEELLSVDDPLSNWFDKTVIDEIENADKVSLRQLLNHTSGIRDYLSVEQFVDAVNTPYFQETQEEKLEYIYGKKADFAPSEKYGYSNSNYVLLGLIIEKARQMPLWDAVEQFIVQPLSLKTTTMGTHDEPIPKGTARPYLALNGDKYFDILQHAVSDAATGDGGIASNTQDLNIFIESLFAGQLLSANTLEQMTQTLTLTGEAEADFPQWKDEAYGFGISFFRTPYGDAYGHTGSTSSYNAYLFHFPNQSVSISIAYNGSSFSGDVGRKKREMRERLFEIIFQ